jgi:hypothetical protein
LLLQGKIVAFDCRSSINIPTGDYWQCKYRVLQMFNIINQFIDSTEWISKCIDLIYS